MIEMTLLSKSQPLCAAPANLMLIYHIFIIITIDNYPLKDISEPINSVFVI